MRLPLVKTDISKAISYSGASLFLFVTLPGDIKTIENYTVSSFTIKLKKFFLQLNRKVQDVDEFSCAICKHVVLCQCFGGRS